MSELFTLFLNNLLPIFLAAGAGSLLARRFGIKAQDLSRITFYIFSPCLAYKLLTTNALPEAELLRMVWFTLLVMAILGGLAWLAALLLRQERPVRSAMLLTALFQNAGNYGMPLVAFAFGDVALAYATIFFLVSLTLVNTLGVLVGSSGQMNLRQALLNLFSIPAVYAVAGAMLFTRMGWQMPLPAERAIFLMADAAIPGMLVVLGLQLQVTRWRSRLAPLTTITLLRLAAAPLVGLGVSLLLGLQGPARQAGIIQAAMPTAVYTTIIATEYNLEPAFVTEVVFVTTLLSPLALTPLLAMLGA